VPCNPTYLPTYRPDIRVSKADPPLDDIYTLVAICRQHVSVAVAVRLYAYTVLIATAQTPSCNNYLRSPSEYSCLRNAELNQVLKFTNAADRVLTTGNFFPSIMRDRESLCAWAALPVGRTILSKRGTWNGAGDWLRTREEN
jgi:hypothetical protein